MSQKDAIIPNNIEEPIWSAFKALLKYLQRSIPIITTISIAFMRGSSLVNIPGFGNIPRLTAIIVSVLLLIIVYLTAYRTLLILKQSLLSGSLQNIKIKILVIDRIKRESTLLNPFSSTLPTRSLTDYIGLVMLHIPLLVILLTGSWTLSEGRSAITNTLNEINIQNNQVENLEENLQAMTVSERYEWLETYFESTDTIGAEWFKIFKISLINVIRFCLVGMYILFLWELGWILFLVNTEDFIKRLYILIISGALLILPIIVIDIISLIRFIIFNIKVFSIL